MLNTIVIVNDRAYVSGGAGKVALTSAKLLAEKGYRAILFTAVGPIDETLLSSGVEVICLGQQGILQEKNKLRAVFQGIWNQYAYKKFLDLLNQLNPENTIIHYHGWSKSLSASILGAVVNTQFRIVATMHDYFLICPNLGLYNYQTHKICTHKPSSVLCYLSNCDSRNYVYKIFRSIRGVVQMRILKRLKGKLNIITIGRINREVCYDSLNPYVNKWYHVQNPIELNYRKPVDILNNDKYLFVGRLSPEKGVTLFCEILTQLKLKGIVLGNGQLFDSLKDKYPNIEFAGWVTGSEMESRVRECKALIFPSLWYEGAPLTISEMMSYGIPCIVPDKCAAAEQVIDGKTGLIFKIADKESLKDTILKFETMDLRTIQENIQNCFKPQNLNMNTHINRLIEVYESIVQK